MKNYIRNNDKNYRNEKEANMTDEFIQNWLTQNGAKNRMWVELGSVLGVTTSQVHNYYHNTWSKRFYVDAEQFKKELHDIMSEVYSNQTDSRELIRLTKEEFLDHHRDVTFHSGYLLQLMYRVLYQLRKQNNAPTDRAQRSTHAEHRAPDNDAVKNIDE
jgi:predicted transcriptional regulator